MGSTRAEIGSEIDLTEMAQRMKAAGTILEHCKLYVPYLKLHPETQTEIIEISDKTLIDFALCINVNTLLDQIDCQLAAQLPVNIFIAAASAAYLKIKG